MKKLQLIALLAAMVGNLLCAGECPLNCPAPPAGRHSSSRGDVSGKVDRMLEDAEDAERRLSRVKPGSKDEMVWRHRREDIALQIIHEAQIFFLEQGTVRDDGRTRLMRMLLDNESAYLQRSLSEVRDFPYLTYLSNPQVLIAEIRSGKVQFPERVPRSDTLLLREIQKLQREFLEEYQRQAERNFRK